MDTGVVGPWQLNNPGPGLAMHLGLDCLEFVVVGAGDGGQVAPLLQPMQGVWGGAEAELRVLVQASTLGQMVRRRLT